MDAVQVVSLVSGILGMVTGSVALTISILTYRRDRSSLKVLLQWDMTNSQTREMIGLVRVTNIGRRPAYLGTVSLELPSKYKHDYLVLTESLQGTCLKEADPPAVIRVNYDGLAQYKADWNKIRAMAQDSTGKAYYSAYPRKKPSWAN